MKRNQQDFLETPIEVFTEEQEKAMPIRYLCSADGCDEASKLKGMCIYHYHRKRYKGDSPSHPSKRLRIIKICFLNSCDREVQATSLCQKHYRQYHRLKTKKLIANAEEFKEMSHEKYRNRQKS